MYDDNLDRRDLGYDVVYDDCGEVAAATVAGRSETHSYDFIGNEYESNCLNQPIWVPEYGGVWYDTCGRVEVHHIDSEMPAFLLTYDAMHRLASASLLAEPNTLVQSNVYDNVGRRVMKYAPDGVHRYYYDDWLLRLETIEHDGVTDSIEYIWGKDISGSIGGAAGIGGLLYTKINGVIYVPQYDAYGNIIEYCDSTGAVVATYTYDAFGLTIAQSGALADVFAFRYSTKYFDRETGFYYYGKRYYSPALRRWLTRDPIGEEGGVNLYGFCENRPIHFHDEIGCIAVKYVAWQDNGWFVKLFSGEAMSLIEVSSAEEIPIVIKTLNLNGAFSVAPSFVNDCEMQVLLQVVLSDQLKDKAQRGERFSVKPHDNNGGGGVSFSLLGGRSTYGAIKAHGLGHAQAFFESTIKNFENKAAAYLSKNRLSEKEKLKVVSLFYEAYNDDISESGRRASLREKFWYEGNGFNIIDKEDHYEAVFR